MRLALRSYLAKNFCPTRWRGSKRNADAATATACRVMLKLCNPPKVDRFERHSHCCDTNYTCHAAGHGHIRERQCAIRSSWRTRDRGEHVCGLVHDLLPDLIGLTLQNLTSFASGQLIGQGIAEAGVSSQYECGAAYWGALHDPLADGKVDWHTDRTCLDRGNQRSQTLVHVPIISSPHLLMRQPTVGVG